MYDAVIKGDLSRFYACFDENLVLDEPSFLPYGGRYAGMARLQELIGILTSYLNFSTIKLDKLIADGDTAVAFLRVQTVKSPSEVQLAERSIVRNGKIVDVRVLFHELGSMVSEIKG